MSCVSCVWKVQVLADIAGGGRQEMGCSKAVHPVKLWMGGTGCRCALLNMDHLQWCWRWR